MAGEEEGGSEHTALPFPSLSREAAARAQELGARPRGREVSPAALTLAGALGG